ncbi:MAG: DUF4421 family protein [Bacteroidales bacterium]|nr:DUF4421 family protein [Bacteroidales bacterium]
MPAKNRIFFLVALILFSFQLKSQSYIPARYPNIERYDGFVIKALIQSPLLALDISDRYNIGKKISYSPNIVESIGAGFASNFIGLSIFTKLPRDEEKDLKYGRTEYSNLQVFLYGRRIALEASYQNYQGFYLLNAPSFDVNWNDSSKYPTIPGMELRNLTINCFYIFSRKFSLKASFNQTERQLRSAGSFLLMASLNHIYINSDSSLIPKTEKQNYSEFDAFRWGEFYNYEISPGYAYSIILKRFYFTPMLFIGGGYQKQECDIKSKSEFGYKLGLKYFIGYNGKKFVIGAFGMNDICYANISNAILQFYASKYRFFVGYRL